MVTRMRWAALSLLSLLAAAQMLSATAGAHSYPIQVHPASGSVVPAPPREVVITFSEALDSSFSSMTVQDANGSAVSAPSTIDPDSLTMRAALPPSLAYGAYSVRWRALSAVDGHTSHGMTSFLFPDPSKPLRPEDLPPADASQEALVGPFDGILRGAMFAGVLVSLGTGMLFVAVAGRAGVRSDTRRALGLLVLAAGLVGAGATVALAVSQAAVASQRGIVEVLGQPALAFVGRYGNLAAIRAPLQILAGALGWAAARTTGPEASDGGARPSPARAPRSSR
jgi:methionine-rich copper-binding protein CopC